MSGGKHKHINRAIQELAKVLKISLPPTTTLHHKVIATAGAEELTDAEVRNLADTMCHSENTAKRHYRMQMGREQSAKTHGIIKTLVASRSLWTQEECDAVLTEYPTTNETTPSLKQCAEIFNKKKRHPLWASD